MGRPIRSISTRAVASRIMTPGGNTVPGSWSATNGQLCLSASGAQECVPYNSPFQAGQPLTMTSSCNAPRPGLPRRPTGRRCKARRASAADRLAPTPQIVVRIAAASLGRGREAFMEGVERRIVGQVEVKRADRDIAVGDRFEIGRMARAFRPSARARTSNNHSPCGSVRCDDPQPPVIAQPLAADADALDLVGRHRGEIDVDQGPAARSRTRSAAPAPARPMPRRPRRARCRPCPRVNRPG